MRSVRAHRSAPTLVGGFTLIEVVVALVILAGALAAVLPQFGAALRLGTGASDQRAALLAAQSILAEIGARPAPGDGPLSGGIGDRLNWTAALRPIPLTAEPTAGRGRPFLPPYEVTVEVATSAGQPLASLTTIVLGRP